MGILTGFFKTKKYRKTDDGYKLQSEWTSSQTVEMDDGKTLENTINMINRKWNKMSNTDIVGNSDYIKKLDIYAGAIYSNPNIDDFLIRASIVGGNYNIILTIPVPEKELIVGNIFRDGYYATGGQNAMIEFLYDDDGLKLKDFFLNGSNTITITKEDGSTEVVSAMNAVKWMLYYR